MKKTILLSIIFLLLSAGFVSAQESEIPIDMFQYQEPTATYYEKAKILEISGFGEIQDINLKILSGKYKGEEKTVENSMLYNPLGLEFKVNNKVVVYIEEFADGTSSLYIQDFWRLWPLIGLIIGFLLLLLIVGRMQGFKTILSLIISIVLIFYFLIPRMLDGGNPIVLALIISVIVTVITLLLVSGLKKKSVAAILGTIGGLLIATVLAITIGKIANMTGLSNEESRLLYANFPNLNLRGLLFAGIIIGALGAIMDVGMSIASSIAEVKKAHSKISFTGLVKSGLTIGRDIMGTMTNTLIFAYVGVSLPLLLLFTELGESYIKFLNFEFIAEEVIRAMTGSIGLIATLPLTAIIAAYLESKK
ncbi:MAG: YibE/F family protein [Patescibacteria group bacterium]|nr:YibE/F family protein [Patescibacteria group bacterium]